MMPIAGTGAVTSVVAADVKAGLSIDAWTLLYFRSAMTPTNPRSSDTKSHS